MKRAMISLTDRSCPGESCSNVILKILFNYSFSERGHQAESDNDDNKKSRF